MDSNSVKKIIENVIEKINEDPFIVHREADIQAMIYNQLCKKYDELYPTKLVDITGKIFQTSLVHCEYYFGKVEDNKQSKKKFDIVIFNKNDAENINTHWLRIKKGGSEETVKLDHVIEIKFETGLGGKNITNYQGSPMESDIKKLLYLKNNKDCVNLHFVYILRLWGRPNDKFNSIIKNAKNVRTKITKNCGKNITHYFNENFYFYKAKTIP
jgi:hypothetical protein